MTGWFMHDLNFMKLSAKGIYSWLQCVQHKVPFNEENAARLKKSDDRGYRRKKQTTLGTLYGMSASVLAQTYPDDFANELEAKLEQDFLLTAIPALKVFQDGAKHAAHKETFLTSPWGYRRYFYDVFVHAKDRWGVWRKKEGGGADKAVAFKPQNSNTAFQRDNILEIEKTWLKDYKPANLFVHDSLTYEVPDDRVEEAAAILERVMTRPIPEMSNLRCGIEIETGKSWGDYDEEKNPQGMKLLRAVLIEPTEDMLPNYQEKQAA
jgi:DNA polymerase I-like protein with 3'-5' exonuclease and polymerase domains